MIAQPEAAKEPNIQSRQASSDDGRTWSSRRQDALIKESRELVNNVLNDLVDLFGDPLEELVVAICDKEHGP